MFIGPWLSNAGYQCNISCAGDEMGAPPGEALMEESGEEAGEEEEEQHRSWF